MKLRSLFLWLHLSTGVTAGAVILVMSVTGAILAYERQITAWADRDFRSAPPSVGASHLSVETLLGQVREARPDARATALTLRADPQAPAALALGREGTLYVDVYSGRVLGEGSKRVRAFFRGVTDWHRWLGAEGEIRERARALTGAGNLAFLFLVASGFYLWWPRKWSRPALRSVVRFDGDLRGKARDFNWHNVIGFWSAVPLFLIVLCAVVISYPWANDLLYRATGNEPPPRRTGAPPAGGAGSSEGGRVRRGEAEPRGGPAPGSAAGRGSRAEGRREGSEGMSAAPPSLTGLDGLWARAEQQVPVWQSINLRLPASPDAPVVFSIDQGNGARPDKRAQLTLDRKSGAIVSFEPYSSQNLGRQLRTWARWVHTGEAGGFLGQTLAGLASAGAAVLVWTGLALSWRRFLAWRRRRNMPAADLRAAEPTGRTGIAVPADLVSGTDSRSGA